MRDGLRFTLWWLRWPAVMGRSRLRRLCSLGWPMQGCRGEPSYRLRWRSVTSPSWSGLVKSVLVRAETWMGSKEAPLLLKQLRAPGGVAVDSVLQWLRTGQDSWSLQRT